VPGSLLTVRGLFHRLEGVEVLHDLQNGGLLGIEFLVLLAVVQDFAGLCLAFQAEDPLVPAGQEHAGDAGEVLAGHGGVGCGVEVVKELEAEAGVFLGVTADLVEDAGHVLVLAGHTGSVSGVAQAHSGPDKGLSLPVVQGDGRALGHGPVHGGHVLGDSDLDAADGAVEGPDVAHTHDEVAVYVVELAQEVFDCLHGVLGAHLFIGAVGVGHADLHIPVGQKLALVVELVDAGDGVSVDLDAAVGVVCVVEDHE